MSEQDQPSDDNWIAIRLDELTMDQVIDLVADVYRIDRDLVAGMNTRELTILLKERPDT